jgi:hypothetical protein
MADRTGQITEDIKAIARTRAEISEKVEALRGGISATVEQTKDGVQQVVQQARDTAVDFAQETKRTFVQQTRRAFDPAYQLRRHPWLIVGVMIALGYALRTRATGPRTPTSGGRSPWRMVGPEALEGLMRAQQEILNDVVPVVQDEMGKIQERLTILGRTFLQRMARQAVRAVAEPLEAAFRKGP